MNTNPTRVAFYGGSFNPPHYGHFLATTWALCTGEIDEIWMVPCARHALGKELAPFEHRLAMCKLGAQLLGSRIKISDTEKDQSKPSYTIDTLRKLHAQFPHLQFRLLVGSDIIQEKDSWKEFEALTTLAPLLQVPRGGWHDPDASTPQLPAISSSSIRRALFDGTETSHTLPPPIKTYIETHQLYTSISSTIPSLDSKPPRHS